MTQIEKEKKKYFIKHINSWSSELIIMSEKTKTFMEVLEYVNSKDEHKNAINEINDEINELLEKSALIIDDIRAEYGFPPNL